MAGRAEAISDLLTPMDLANFLTGNDRIDFVEIVSFRPFLQPSFVVLRGPKGRVTQLAVEMRNIAEKVEVGVLRFLDHPTSIGNRITRPGGRVLSHCYLAAPGYDFVSGIRIELDVGELIFTAGDFPYSVFLQFHRCRWGRLEYALEQYRPIRGI